MLNYTLAFTMERREKKKENGKKIPGREFITLEWRDDTQYIQSYEECECKSMSNNKE